ncbi:hypothetical protein N7490_010223 [Penicillium lividum]|nr:hypothetical protein N7490_010223 [Penicillium lividum]
MSRWLNFDRKLTAHKKYMVNPPTKRLCYGKTRWIASCFVNDIIVAHYNLRAAVQRADYLERQMQGMPCPNPKSDAELELDVRKISILERNLYECESKVSPRAKWMLSYKLLRTNPAWYLRTVDAAKPVKPQNG